MSRRTMQFNRARLRELEDKDSRLAMMRDADRDPYAKVRGMRDVPLKAAAPVSAPKRNAPEAKTGGGRDS